MQLTISGIQAAQQDNLRIVNQLQPSGGLGQAVRVATVFLHRMAVINTHVDTGALRAAHRMTFNFGINPEGVISVDTGARNPRTGKAPAEYGYYEENRDGSHAFYGITFEANAEYAGMLGADTLARML